MAELGEAARRLLDPRWSTVRGTVRQWTDHRRSTGFLEGGRRGAMPMIVSGATPPGSAEEERFVRIWRDGRARERIEHAPDPAGPAFLAIYDDGEARVLVHADGSARRMPQAPNVGIGTPSAWLGDPDLLLGVLGVRFTGTRTWMGRPVADATVEPVIPATRAVRRFGPMLEGFVIGASGSIVVDQATGLVVRYRADDDAGRPLFVAEFLDLVVDEPLPEGLFRYVPPPGVTVRAAYQDFLDAAAERGVDVTDLDPEDPASMRALGERDHGRTGGSAPVPPVASRPLSELVVPLGPGPADPGAAEAAIQEALDALGDEDRPRAEGVERGAILDRDAEAGNGPQRHPVLGDQTVTFVLGSVAFVRPDEALVELQIVLSGGAAFPVKGRAVLTADGWRLSYETWAGLQTMGGYRVPSVREGTDDGP